MNRWSKLTAAADDCLRYIHGSPMPPSKEYAILHNGNYAEQLCVDQETAIRRCREIIAEADKNPSLR